METIQISGLNRSAVRVALGTWAIGGWMWGGTDEKESIDTILKALDTGVNMIDTAPVYGFGKSEELVGKAIKQFGFRQNVILATKVGMEWNEKEEVRRNSSRKRIEKEIDDSLKRLQTDYIDIYMVHWPDSSVPFEETAETMFNLHEKGKIKAIGVSNYSVEQMEQFKKAAPLHVLQPPFNLFEDEFRKDLLPYCRSNNITTLAYGALCRGLLSGKMSKDREFEGDDLRKSDPKFQGNRFDDYLKAVDLLDAFAQEKYGHNVIHLAVRWILDQGASIALWGARNPEQIDGVQDVFGWSLDDQAMKEIDRIVVESIKDPVGPSFMAPPENK